MATCTADVAVIEASMALVRRLTGLPAVAMPSPRELGELGERFP